MKIEKYVQVLELEKAKCDISELRGWQFLLR